MTRVRLHPGDLLVDIYGSCWRVGYQAPPVYITLEGTASAGRQGYSIRLDSDAARMCGPFRRHHGS